MSIATALGLDVYDPLQIIESRWASWVDAEPALADVPDPLELEEWLAKDRMRADPGHWQVANEVMLGLARLAAVDGGDDGDAALVLAWLLLPTAIRAAAWYRPAAPEDWAAGWNPDRLIFMFQAALLVSYQSCSASFGVRY